jgi:hypothetical protein
MQWFAFALVFVVGFVAFTWGPGARAGSTFTADHPGRDLGGMGNAQDD